MNLLTFQQHSVFTRFPYEYLSVLEVAGLDTKSPLGTSPRSVDPGGSIVGLRGTHSLVLLMLVKHAISQVVLSLWCLDLSRLS